MSRAGPLAFGEKSTGRVEARGRPQRRELVGVTALAQHSAVRGRDENGPAEHDRHFRDQLIEAAAVQQDRDECPVHLLAALEQGRLPVEHFGEHLVEDVVEPDAVGKLYEGKAAVVCDVERLLGLQVRSVTVLVDGVGS